MEPYKNLNGDSGVEAFEIGPDAISVKFWKTKKVYVYTHRSAGRANVEHMKSLALAGRGLNAFINTNPEVKNGYEK